MQIAFMINDRFCPPGIVAQIVAEAGHEIVELYPHEGGLLPTDVPDSWDGLIVFGGRVSAYDDEQFPAMPRLTQLISQVHAAQVPYLGICLGAQQLGRALGGPRVKMKTVELGFVPMHLTRDGQRDALLRGINAPPVMQVHEDSFVIPEDGDLLLSGDKVTNQAFRVGASSYGFQCHFEVIEEDLIEWLNALENKPESLWSAEQIEMIRIARDRRAWLLPEAQKFGIEVTRRWLGLAARSTVAA